MLCALQRLGRPECRKAHDSRYRRRRAQITVGMAQHADLTQMRRRPVPALSAYPYDSGVSLVPAPVIKSGDPVEQEKQLKYASLVANTIMLSNVADMTTGLSDMAADGQPVTPALVACASPYIRGHILRFGQYALDMSDLPSPLDPQPLPFEPAL
jgi:hypothetical protein